MKHEHLSGEELLLAADGELALERMAHFRSCVQCQDRLADLESIAGLLARPLESSDYDRDGLDRARSSLRQRIGKASFAGRHARLIGLLAIAAGLFAVMVGVVPRTPNPGPREILERPDARLTPGASRAVTPELLCAAPELQVSISSAEAKKVFTAYGLERPMPRAYELDFLIPPSLGGASLAGNLWPQPYRGGIWNSRVKDALEDHLLALLCQGKIDLASAQRELTQDWIGAYQRRFQTRQPLPEHFAFVKDPAWE